LRIVGAASNACKLFDRLATSTNFWKVGCMERYPNGMPIAALSFQLRLGRPDDALAILEAQRSAIRQTAASAYSPAIIDEWAPAIIVPERVDAFRRWIERGEELIVVAVVPTGGIIGFGSIVPANSELRAVYMDAAYGRQGVGRALLVRLEELARHAGLAELRMDASVNAVPFYEANGFISLERAEHLMSSGGRMACVRMRKLLPSRLLVLRDRHGHNRAC
jgi:GNAT superfamily N-acetyltransferase